MPNMQTEVTFTHPPKRIWYVSNDNTSQITLVDPNTRTQARLRRDAMKAIGTPASVSCYVPTDKATHA